MSVQAQLTARSIHSAIKVVLDTSYQGIDEAGWKKLFTTARKSGLEQFIEDMFAGKHVNSSEDRPALHSALRNLTKTPVLINGVDVMPEVAGVWHRIEVLCNEWVDDTDVIHIGIGGSDFGPRLAIEALAHVPGIESHGMRLHFLAKIDTAELSRILARAASFCASPKKSKSQVTKVSRATILVFPRELPAPVLELMLTSDPPTI
jgi:glucose-6-phosphate isomerase